MKNALFLVSLAMLATWPVELVNAWMGWGAMEPASYLPEIAWLPILALCQLAMLRRVGQIQNPAAGRPPITGGVLLSAIGIEFLLGLRFCVVILLASIPALVALSTLGLERVWTRVLIGSLAFAGAVPSLLYVMRRLCAPAVLLWQGLNASQCLAESRRLTVGKLGRVFWPLLLINGFALILEQLYGDSLSGSLVVMPLSLLMSVAVLAWAYRILTL